MTSPTFKFYIFLEGCGAFGLVGSIGPCVFDDWKDCLLRAEEIQKEQNLSLPPVCVEVETEVWFE